MNLAENKPVTVSLAASPACDQTGAMCTADDPPRPVRAATATVPYKRLVTITDIACPLRHDGSSSVVVGFTFSSELAASTASILDRLTVTNAIIVSSGWEGRRLRGVVRHTGSDRRPPVRPCVSTPSVPCDEPGALCTADGRGVQPERRWFATYTARRQPSRTRRRRSWTCRPSTTAARRSRCGSRCRRRSIRRRGVPGGPLLGGERDGRRADAGGRPPRPLGGVGDAVRRGPRDGARGAGRLRRAGPTGVHRLQTGATAPWRRRR